MNKHWIPARTCCYFLLKKENQKIGEAVTLSAIDDLGRALRVGVVIAGELR